MPAAVSTTAGSTTPETPVSRPIKLVRVAVLLLSGIAIAFSATLHEQLSFDLGMAALTIGAVGIAHLVEWWSLRSSGGNPLPLLLGAVSLAAALGLALADTVIVFALVVAGWALLSALLEFVGMAVRPGSRQDAVFLGATGMLLALLVILVRTDEVAVLGFLGAYAVLAGVFLGISAFDTRRAHAPSDGASSDRSPLSSPPESRR
ncbi:hypothetical protein [Leucobacter chromiiresistens]|uniref:DUF308 domain-containing protein n=1 Tax=Leucobacter chromiiresistens TaxID=1079994 RepID=A0A1H0Y7H9_9MICO|nr:hypothetical protein [Leucobacter chromiiresistens]SDQ11108.1 hypothetical protein SAMN04488565_0596 [Leucobacter chromiiresistens]